MQVFGRSIFNRRSHLIPVLSRDLSSELRSLSTGRGRSSRCVRFARLLGPARLWKNTRLAAVWTASIRRTAGLIAGQKLQLRQHQGLPRFSLDQNLLSRVFRVAPSKPTGIQPSANMHVLKTSLRDHRTFFTSGSFTTIV
jgi:hypothetical protein